MTEARFFGIGKAIPASGEERLVAGDRVALELAKARREVLHLLRILVGDVDLPARQAGITSACVFLGHPPRDPRDPSEKLDHERGCFCRRRDWV